MADGKFKAWDTNGALLVDTTKISYGLVLAGNMYYLDTWRRWQLRSAQLDPNDPSNYAQTNPMDGIFGFSIANVNMPIVFVYGSGVFVGSSRNGNITTFYYAFANTDTRFYCYDIMTYIGAGAGMKCFADTPTQECTFNSRMIPLNIVSKVQYPAPPPPNQLGTYNVPFNGASKSYERPWSSNPVNNLVARLPVTLGGSAYAACSSFSRSMAAGRHDNMSPPGGASGGTPMYSGYMGQLDGVYGVGGGIHIVAIDAPRTQMIAPSTAVIQAYTGIPQDKFPVALVIDISALPFPYSVF